jgi:ubiquinone/menaquinone biosynthesis C-methylase UbiE
MLIAEDATEVDMHDRRFAAGSAHRLDDPARKIWLPPAEVLAALNVHGGISVADVGAGTGYFTLPMAEAAGPEGKIYAVDAQGEMLALLIEKVARAGLLNIEFSTAPAENTELAPSCCEIYLLANVWHELDDCDAAVKEAKRVLKPGGRAAILDWRPDVEPEPGPPLAHRLGPAHAMEHLQAAGFHTISQMTIGLYSWLVQAEV